MNNTKANILSKLMRLQNEKANKYLSSFADDLVVSINNCKNNDQILESLELLDKIVYVVPKQIIRAIKPIIDNQKPLKPKVRTVTGWGKVEGKKHVDLVIECIGLLGKIRYIKPKETFSLLVKLSLYPDQTIQSEAKDVLKRMTEYNLFVLEKINYYPQFTILEEIEKWGSRKLVDLFDVVLEISRQLLSPTYEGHEMTDYKTMVLHSGVLPVDDNLKNIRERTIEILKKLYLHTKELKQKQKIIQALHEATRSPSRGGNVKDMKEMLRSNTNVLIDYYISIVPKAENEIIKIIEKKIHFIRRHRKGKYPRMKELLTLIASNLEYEMFSIFVDYDYGVSEDLDRKAKIQEFINDISGKDYKSLEVKILSVIKNYPKMEDRGAYRYFNFFLNELAKQKPEIADKLIENKEAVLKPFLFYLLVGIWESKTRERARSIISEWVCKGKHLSPCASIFEYVKEIDKSIIDKIFRKAKKEKNTDALLTIIGVIDKKYPKNKNTRTLFVDIVKELTKYSNSMWTNYIWHNKDSVLKTLTKAEYNIILDNLLHVTNIGYNVEEILMPIAEKYPKQVINFLQKRVLVQSKKQRDDRYDAIPFEFTEVNVPLGKKAKIVVPEILRWFSKKKRILSWTGGSLLHKIFPSFNDILEKELIKLIKTKSNKNTEVVLDILKHYEGEEFLHNVCKTLIKTYPKNDRYKKEMFRILSQMGIVSGEYGFVEGYRKKKVEIQSWKKDKSKAIKSFVTKYEDYLDRRISIEQKRADEGLELRKREYES